MNIKIITYFISLLFILLLLNGCSRDESIVAPPSYTPPDWAKINVPYQASIKSIATTGTDTIYAGTRYGGLYASYNRGISWERIVVERRKEDINFVSTSPDGKVFLSIAGRGLFRSVDAGKSWENIANSENAHSIYSIAYLNNENIIIGTSGGILCSSEDGQNWYTTEGLPSSLVVHCLHQTIDKIIYAGTNDGVFHSTDGLKWYGPDFGSQGYEILSISSLSSGVPIAGTMGNGILAFDEKREMWKKVADGQVPAAISAIAVDSKGTIYIGTKEGIFRSSNVAFGWQKIGGENAPTRVNCVDVGEDNLLLCGTEFDGIYLSNDNGESWATSNNGLDASFVTCIESGAGGYTYIGTLSGVYTIEHDANGWVQTGFGLRGKTVSCLKCQRMGSIYAGTNEGLFRKSFGDVSWKKVENIFNNASIYDVDTYGDNEILVASSAGFFRSDDNGKNWRELTQISSYYPITAVAVSDSGYIFAGSCSGTQLRSRDGGTNWKILDADIQFCNKHFLLSHPDGLLFAVGPICNSGWGVGALKISRDWGASWHIIPSIAAYSIYFLTIGASGEIYILYENKYNFCNGAAVSSNLGTTWEKLNRGIQTLDLTCLGTDIDGNIFIGTHGNGLYIRNN